MTPERAEMLADLETKARIMNVLIIVNKVRMPRFDPTTLITQTAFNLHINYAQVEGLDNLQRGLDQAAEGKKVIFTPRHKADFETPGFRVGLEKAGYRHVANNVVWIAGVNMLKRPYIAPFTFSEEAIYIATPEDLSNARELLDNPDLTPVDRRRAIWIQSILQTINSKAKKEVKRTFEEGKFLAIYPEAGRSKDGFLRRAPREVSIYFPRDGSAIIIPLIINGPDRINPPGQNWSLDRVHPNNRQTLEIKIGEPYQSDEVWHWPDDRSAREKNRADWVMANIANIDPRGVREEELEQYREMMIQYRPERNKIPENLGKVA